MQYIGDDMEDLFQRAAENYRLDEGPDEWETIGQTIAAGRPNLPEAKSDQKYRKSIATFLLILLFSGALYIVLKDQAIPLQKEARPKYAAAAVISKQQNYQQPGAKTANLKQASSYKFNHYNSAVKPIVAKTKTNTRGAFNSDLTRLGNVGVTASHEGFTNETSTAKSVIPYKNSSEHLEETITNNNKSPNPEPPKNAPETAGIENKTVVSENARLTPSFKKTLYVGLVAGGDLSKVKSMPFNHAGLSAGVTLEYKFAAQWSLQSGIIINRKNYSGQGVDFNTDKVQTTMSGMTIKHFESRSTLLEIPITVKLYLNARHAQHFFVAAGVASYATTKEANKYDVMHNGQPETFSANYNSNNYKAMAAATLSAGYQTKVSHNNYLSIAPYFNTPLRGVGVGSLPLTSAGVRVVLSTRVK